MFAHEAGNPAPMPEGAARQQTAVDLRGVAVRHHRLGHVPTLPAGFRRAVAELDVLAVEPKVFVEAAQLFQHLALHQQEGGEHPIRLHGFERSLVEQVVVALPLEGTQRVAKRGPADERAGYRRKAALRGLPAPVRIAQLRAGDAAASAREGEVA